MKSLPTPVSMEIFWQTLTKAELVRGEMPTDSAAVPSEASPWFVKLMLGAAAWLSALLFLFFLGVLLGSLFWNEWAQMTLGVTSCAMAVWYFARGKSSIFFDQIFFVTALLGQGLVLSVVFGWFRWTTSNVWLLAALFEVAVMVAINYPPSRFLSALAALIFLFRTLVLIGASDLFMPLCLAALAWVLHHQWKRPRFWPAVALALCTAPVLIAIFHGSSIVNWLFESINDVDFLLKIPFWASRIVLICIWLGIVYVLLKQATSAPFSPKNVGVWLLAILLAVGTWPMPLALFALAVLALGFSQRDRFLEGIGIAQLLWSVGYYYYALQDTLLFKSLSLFALGCLLLLLYAASHYLSPGEHGTEKKS